MDTLKDFLGAASTSEVRAIDKRYNLYLNILSRIRQLDFHAMALSDKNRNYLASKSRLKEMSDLLDSNSLITHDGEGTPIVVEDVYPELYKEFKLLGDVKNHMIDVFGEYLKPTSNNLNSFERSFIQSVKDNGIKARVGELVWRIKSELSNTTEQGWFCIFQTLTIPTT